VSFMWPTSRTKAETFWRRIAESAGRRERLVLAAEGSTGAIVGTVQVALDLPEKPRRRCEDAGA
jgi:hypothetical protein